MNEKPAFDTCRPAAAVPPTERVLDRLADILFATDEILDLIRAGEIPLDQTTTMIEGSVRHVYDQVNDLMKRLTN